MAMTKLSETRNRGIYSGYIKKPMSLIQIDTLDFDYTLRSGEDDIVIITETSADECTINLPEVSDGEVNGRPVTFVGARGAAGGVTTITAFSGEEVNGATTYTLNTDGVATFIPSALGWHLVSLIAGTDPT